MACKVEQGTRVGSEASFLALNLEERLAIGDLGPTSGAGTGLDAEAQRMAAWRLGKWSAQSPFDRGDYFARRLRLAGLSEEDLYFLAAESGSSVAARAGWPTSTLWGQRLDEVQRANEERATDSHPSWLGLLNPFLRDLSRRLRAHLDSVVIAGALPLNLERVLDSLVAPTARFLEAMVSRTIILEMKLEELERELPGATSQERFARFMRHLSKPERTRELFDSYPVLLRPVLTTVEQAGDAGCEVIERLGRDWTSLRQTLLADLGDEKLVAINFGAGDRHRKGRSVAILHFDGGTKLVYKPRELSLDLAFELFLDWFASIGGERQRLPRLLPRGIYGWSEFVEAAPCSSDGEMRRFFLRQGELLAILHCLRAHDFHRENLIAAGEFPVLIDLETLCGPDYGRARPENYPGRAGFELSNSVTRVMLLPYLQEGLHLEILEQSGLGGSDGQRSLLALPQWSNLGTDEMRITRERQELPPSQNHPRIGEALVDTREFENDVVSGFRKGYRLILDHRETLLGKDSPLTILAGTEARVIFRDTAVYSLILRESFHPDLLRNALDRDRIFDRLWFGMDIDPVLDTLEPLLPHEIADFWNGDVPHFTCRTDSRDVVTSQGHVLPDLILSSGMEMIRRTIEEMGETDLEKQASFARASFSALSMSSESERDWLSLNDDGRQLDRATFLSAADAVLRRIGETAYWQGPSASWIGLRPLTKGWQLRALGSDLYSGLPGIALTLAYGARLLDSERYLELSRGALNTLEEDLRRSGAYWGFLGAYMGWGGILYTYIHLAELWRDEQLLDKAVKLLPMVKRLIEKDISYDVIFGSAGCVPPLVYLWRNGHSCEALDLLVALGDRILSGSRPEPRGIGWVTIEPGRSLTGISHGNSGFAWILAEIFRASGDDRFRLASEQAIAYETAVFEPRVRNWPDFRALKGRGDKGPNFAAAWCNGAGGIGLARLRLAATLDRESMEREAEIALDTMVKQGFGDSHCLCHGDIGNLDILLEAATTLGGRWQGEFERLKGLVLAGAERVGWRCGVPRAFETPGLMEGLSGIAYGLMRQADPDLSPSVLLLDLPGSR
jgi:type 2 lantibiotic biosynthesis protein LanM